LESVRDCSSRGLALGRCVTGSGRRGRNERSDGSCLLLSNTCYSSVLLVTSTSECSALASLPAASSNAPSPSPTPEPSSPHLATWRLPRLGRPVSTRRYDVPTSRRRSKARNRVKSRLPIRTSGSTTRIRRKRRSSSRRKASSLASTSTSTPTGKCTQRSLRGTGIILVVRFLSSFLLSSLPRSTRLSRSFLPLAEGRRLLLLHLLFWTRSGSSSPFFLSAVSS
jgi:hypothetical protein